MDVVITKHAQERLRQHYGEQTIPVSAEIRDALEAERYASTRPTWSYLNGERRKRQHKGTPVRFLWPEDRSRIYVVSRRLGGRLLVLLTVYPVEPRW